MKRHYLTEAEVEQFVLVLGLPAATIKSAAKGDRQALIEIRHQYLKDGRLQPKRWR